MDFRGPEGGNFQGFKPFGASGPHGVPNSNVDPRWLHFASFLKHFLPSWTTIWLRIRSHFVIDNFLQDSITCRICKGKDSVLRKLCCHKIRGGGFARMRSWIKRLKGHQSENISGVCKITVRGISVPKLSGMLCTPESAYGYPGGGAAPGGG